jgi:hypothetical protein
MPLMTRPAEMEITSNRPRRPAYQATSPAQKLSESASRKMTTRIASVRATLARWRTSSTASGGTASRRNRDSKRAVTSHSCIVGCRSVLDRPCLRVQGRERADDLPGDRSTSARARAGTPRTSGREIPAPQGRSGRTRTIGRTLDGSRSPARAARRNAGTQVEAARSNRAGRIGYRQVEIS